MVKKGYKHPDYYIIPFRCGKPNCPICRNIKRKRLMRRLQSATWPKRIVLWTITTDPGTLDPAEAIKTINHRWHLVCRNLLRHYPGMKFFRVLEFTKSGLPHLHIIFNKRIEWRVLQEMVISQQFGRVLNFTVLPRDQAMHYLTKYLTKALANYQLSRQLHIRSWSASIRFLPVAHYFSDAIEFSIIYVDRLSMRLDRVLHDAMIHRLDEHVPP